MTVKVRAPVPALAGELWLGPVEFGAVLLCTGRFVFNGVCGFTTPLLGSIGGAADWPVTGTSACRAEAVGVAATSSKSATGIAHRGFTRSDLTSALWSLWMSSTIAQPVVHT
jgi:hypothetical protein